MKIKTLAGTALVAALLSTACSSNNNETDNSATVSEIEEGVVSEGDTPTLNAEWIPDSAIVLDSGLAIVIENPGDDTRATKTSPVTLHYRGRLTNGTVFDSSYDRGVPATFAANQVIPGFGEGIMQIGKGGKATLYIPSNLGYGPQGTPGGPIGPNENLIFDIEIVDIANP